MPAKSPTVRSPLCRSLHFFATFDILAFGGTLQHLPQPHLNLIGVSKLTLPNYQDPEPSSPKLSTLRRVAQPVVVNFGAPECAAERWNTWRCPTLRLWAILVPVPEAAVNKYRPTLRQVRKIGSTRKVPIVETIPQAHFCYQGCRGQLDRCSGLGNAAHHLRPLAFRYDVPASRWDDSRIHATSFWYSFTV